VIRALSIGVVSRALEKEIKRHARAIQVGSVRALNKTAVSVRAAASKEIRGTLNVKAAFVKKSLRIKRARRGALKSEISSIHQSIPLNQFSGVRPTKKGLSVKMRKDKARKLFNGAFIYQSVIFRRLSRSRLPIRPLYGPSVHAIFGERIERLVAIGDPILEKNLNREIAFALSK